MTRVSREQLRIVFRLALVNGKAGVSAEMVIRLAAAFGSSAEVWLGLQLQYDLAQATKRRPGPCRDQRSLHSVDGHYGLGA